MNQRIQIEAIARDHHLVIVTYNEDLRCCWEGLGGVKGASEAAERASETAEKASKAAERASEAVERA